MYDIFIQLKKISLCFGVEIVKYGKTNKPYQNVSTRCFLIPFTIAVQGNLVYLRLGN